MGGAGSPSNKYTITADKSVYNMSSTVSVTINGGAYTGHLLGSSSGTFEGCARSSRCDETTCTHVNTNVVADGTSFEWTPSACETVTFRAMIHDQTSSSMYRTESITVTCESAASRLMASVTILFFSALVSISTVVL